MFTRFSFPPRWHCDILRDLDYVQPPEHAPRVSPRDALDGKWRSKVKFRVVADAVGTTGSVICAVHCLAGPMLLLTGSFLPTVLLPDESFHRAMLWLLLPAGAVAFALGCRRHKDLFTLLLGVAGLVGLTVAATALHGLLGETGEKVVTLLATSVLFAGHIRNFRLCRADECQHDCATAQPAQGEDTNASVEGDQDER